MADRKRNVTPREDDSDNGQAQPPKRIKLNKFTWDQANLNALKLLRSDDSSCCYPASDVTCDHQDVTEALPDDLLAKAFFGGYINSLDICKTVSCVNKHFQQVAQSTVKLLDLRSCKSLQASHASNLVDRFQNLSEIDCTYCSQFSNQHLSTLVPITPTLTVLLLRGTAVSDTGFEHYFRDMHNGPSRLQVLDLGTVTKADSLENRITDKTVELVASNCPDMCSLNLDWNRGVTDKSCQALVKLTRLVDLGLFLTCITSAGCTHLAKLINLAKLDISATQMASAASSFGLAEEADIINAQQDKEKDDDDKTVGLRNLFPDRHESSLLRELRLRFHKNLTAEALLRIAHGARHLALLDIRYCNLSKENAKEAFSILQQRGVQILADGSSSNHESGGAVDENQP